MAAITDYTTLLAEISSTINRTDQSANAPGWVKLCEADMNRRLMLNPRLARATATISAGYAAVPTDFGGPVTMRATGTPTRYSYLTPDQYARALDGQATGSPSYYTIIGGEFAFYPIPSDGVEVELVYRQRLPDLASNSTNWLLQNHPDAYLYGSLIHSSPKLKDDRMDMWVSLYAAISEILFSADQIESQGALTPLPNGYAA